MADRNGTAAAIVELQRRFGWRNAVWLLQFQASWALAMQANDWEPIDVETYGEYWRISRASAFRDQRRWRKAFPDERTPNDRLLAVRPLIEEAQAGRKTEVRRDEIAAVLSLASR